MKIIINKLINLEKINKSKKITRELFLLFKSRPTNHHISAKKYIKFKYHKKFINSNPYRYWFIIKYSEKYIGTIYFTFENSVGFFIQNKYIKFSNEILKKTLKKIKPLHKKHSIRQEYFTINISPKNKKYKKIIESLKGKVIQNTYIINKI